MVFPLDQYCRQADYLGAAPLHLAAEQGCPPVVQYLLEVTGAEKKASVKPVPGDDYREVHGPLMKIGEILIG